MKKAILSIVFLFCLSEILPAQNLTTLSGTVTDSASQFWANATWSSQTTVAGAPGTVYFKDGTKVPSITTGQLSSSGVFSGSLPNSNNMYQTGVAQKITLCSNTSFGCVIISNVNIKGSTFNLGTYITNNGGGSGTPLASIKIPSTNMTYAYNSGEVINPKMGDGYTNTISSTVNYWNGTAWISTTASGVNLTPPGFIPFGDSITCYTAASNASLAFVSLERNQIGGRVYDSYCYPGDMALDLNKWQHQAGSPYAGGPNTQIEILTNDVTVYNTNTNLQTVDKRLLLESNLWGGIVDTNKVYGQACTKTIGFAVSDNNFLYGLGQSSVTNGDVLTCSITTGPNGDIALGYLITNNTAGTFTVKVNGVTQNDPFTSSPTWIAYGDGSATITTTNNTTSGYAGAVLTGFAPNTTMPVTFTVTSPSLSTNPVEIGWVGKFPAVSTSNPYVINISPNHQNNANDALSGVYAGFMQSAVTTAQSYGINAIYANTRDGMVADPLCGNGSVSTMFSVCYADVLHPNGPTATTGGHASMARIIVASLPSSLVTNSPPNPFLGAYNTYQINATPPVGPQNMPNVNPYHTLVSNKWGPGLNFGFSGGNISWIATDVAQGLYLGSKGGSISMCQYPSGLFYPTDPSKLVCYLQITSNGVMDMSKSNTVKLGNLVQQNKGPNIAAASTINPFSSFFHITGTATIDTMPAPIANGCFQIIPDGLWSTSTAGNFAVATTAIVGKLLTECYDGTKWYPSY